MGYARQYVHPTLSPEAAQVLQEFYLELRKQNQAADSTPITTRQLESLIRLTEVNASWDAQGIEGKEIMPEVLPKSWLFLQLIHHYSFFCFVKKNARGLEVLKSYCSLKLLIKQNILEEMERNLSLPQKRKSTFFLTFFQFFQSHSPEGEKVCAGRNNLLPTFCFPLQKSLFVICCLTRLHC